MAKIKILTNPAYPNVGQFSFPFYDNTHIAYGDPKIQPRVEESLKRFLGEEVAVTIQGIAIDDDRIQYPWEIEAVINYNQYTDLFGDTDSFYLDAIQDLADTDSDYYGMELVTLSITVQSI